eukprot:Protomagalhaensia_sp_Gyna_25__419@NODE_119_length_5103_cov_179_393167_g93_i0_p1_GENE_NODE_119_length_5103_cov_179_393167_g93_i0NODE_119_length_5103_cov_179_393167_g93_i0_p1_ORF_typecomplete_len532_score33_19RabGAPTBC/PF00566_18/8_5e11_NODE_119_length_5103_cov_179_393167_g93_i0741669
MKQCSAEFEDCQSLEAWSLRLLQRIDKHYFPSSEAGPFYKFSHDPDVLGVRASLLAFGVEKASVEAEWSSSEYEELFVKWEKVHDSWAQVETEAVYESANTHFIVNPSLLPPDITTRELERQIRVDVNRSYSFFDIHRSPTKGFDPEAQREKLTHVIRHLFSHPSARESWRASFESVREPLSRSGEKYSSVEPLELTPVEFRYLQGLHDICCVVMEVAERGAAPLVNEGSTLYHRVSVLCERIVAYRVFPQHSSLSLLMTSHFTLAHVSQLLAVFHPQFFASLVASSHEPLHGTAWRGDGTELHCILPWMMTLFAHSLSTFNMIVAMWSILFAFPPPFFTYWLTAAVIAQGSKQTMLKGVPFLCDATSGVSVPDMLDLLVRATGYVSDCTPLQLMRRCHEDLYLEQDTEWKWFDARDSYVFQPPPKSVLPPFWFPLLGFDALAPKLDTVGLLRGLSTTIIQCYSHSLTRLEFEWKLFRDFVLRGGRHQNGHSQQRLLARLNYLSRNVLLLPIRPVMETVRHLVNQTHHKEE